MNTEVKVLVELLRNNGIFFECGRISHGKIINIVNVKTFITVHNNE